MGNELKDGEYDLEEAARALRAAILPKCEIDQNERANEAFVRMVQSINKIPGSNHIGATFDQVPAANFPMAEMTVVTKHAGTRKITFGVAIAGSTPTIVVTSAPDSQQWFRYDPAGDRWVSTGRCAGGPPDGGSAIALLGSIIASRIP